ncbi:MAG TPA: hypothetical protein V6C91_12750, partial [Coleofasciculaceae cyanobacterium]
EDIALSSGYPYQQLWHIVCKPDFLVGNRIASRIYSPSSCSKIASIQRGHNSTIPSKASVPL